MRRETLALIVPVRNEARQLPSFLAGVQALRARLEWRLELIVVDDASTDGTANLLAVPREGVTVLTLPRHAGQHRALLEGIAFALGREQVGLLATIDADLDPPPVALLRLLPHVTTHDLVVGRRCMRERSLGRIVISALFRLLCNALVGSPLRDHGSMCRVFTREVAARCLQLRRMGTCVAALTLLAASRPTEVPLEPSSSPRRSRYSFWGIARVGLDMLLMVVRVRLRGIRPPRPGAAP